MSRIALIGKSTAKYISLLIDIWNSGAVSYTHLMKRRMHLCAKRRSAARIMRISNIFKGRGRKKKQTNKTDQKADVTEKELTAGL